MSLSDTGTEELHGVIWGSVWGGKHFLGFRAFISHLPTDSNKGPISIVSGRVIYQRGKKICIGVRIVYC